MNRKNFNHVEWSKDANIYEVNLRQYTKEGTFEALQSHLPRLKEMGVDIIWLMPIHPVGLKHRKGTLGSQYAVQNYTGIDPAYGSLDDFKDLVKKTHQLGMYIILDWVANHTAWDNVWVNEHPDWYKKDANGKIYHYTFEADGEIEYWTDVIGLDYTNKALWAGMIDVLKYWIRETNIDGYRCDVAGLVPTDFWNLARTELDQIKPVFMLAEWAETDLHEVAFDMTYNWDLYDLMKEMAEGTKDVSNLKDYLENPKTVYPKSAYRMNFTTNHDKNTWVTDDVSLYGKAFKAYTFLTVTIPGMPLIYSGQESILDKQLDFFEKDTIHWKDYPLKTFYQEMLQLKKSYPVLWNGQYGGDIQILPQTTKDLLVFKRFNTDSALMILINFYPQTITCEIDSIGTISLAPFEYKLFNLSE